MKRTVQWRAGRAPRRGQLILTAVAALVGLVLVMGVAGSGMNRRFMHRHEAPVDGHRSVLGLDFIHVNDGWALDWQPSDVAEADEVLVYGDPPGAVVVNMSGQPGAPVLFFEWLGLGLVGLALLLPAVTMTRHYRFQRVLLQTGRLAQGRIIRHKLPDRHARGRYLTVQYHFQPQGYSEPVEGHMRIRREEFLPLQNGQVVKVLYGASPLDNLVYAFSDYEVDPQYREEFGFIADVAPDSLDEPLPMDLLVKHGFGPTLLLLWGYMRTLLMGAELTAPLWGWTSWGLRRTAAHPVGVPHLVFVAPWLLTILAVLVGFYLINLVFLFWFVKDHEAARIKPSRIPVKK